jgi:hypothetical protein
MAAGVGMRRPGSRLENVQAQRLMTLDVIYNLEKRDINRREKAPDFMFASLRPHPLLSSCSRRNAVNVGRYEPTFITPNI